ncbi:MAG: two-component regulator propeller domain-containing protein, partial [Bacteroidota bacterium]
ATTYLCCVWLFLGGILSCYAQKKLLKFDRLATEHGLSNLDGTSFARDSLGYVWIGTKNGLNRFDGQQVTVYKNQIGDTTSLVNNVVEKVYQDRHARLWILTAQGISRYIFDQDYFRNYVPTGSAQSIFYFDITEDVNGRILLLARDNLVFIYNKATDSFDYLYQIALPEQVDPLVATEQMLYAGYQKSILAIDPTTGKVHERYPLVGTEETPYEKISLKVTQNHLWAVGYGIGIYQMDLQTKAVQHIPSPLVTSIDQYDEEHLLLGGTSGIYKLNISSESITPIQTVLDDGYLVNNAEVMVDEHKAVWIASGGNGIVYGTGNKTFHDVRSINDSLSAQLEQIHYLKRIGDNDLWISLFSGATYVANITAGAYRLLADSDNPQYPHHGTVFQLISGSNNTVWMGTHREGVKIFDATSQTFIRSINATSKLGKIHGNDVRSIVPDRDGHMWLAVHGYGIERFDPVEN